MISGGPWVLNIEIFVNPCLIAVPPRPLTPTPLELNDRRIFGRRKKVKQKELIFSLMTGPLPPPPHLNGAAIKKDFFAASRRSLFSFC